MQQPKPLTLPTADGGCETFDMRTLKLVVRLEQDNLCCIYVLDDNATKYVARNSGASKHFFNSALALVGKFLSDNPTY